MELVKIEPTDDTPGVLLDPERNIVNFNGRSLPEDVSAFYNPILKWLEEYSNEKADKTVVEFKLDYYSSATSKMLMAIMSRIEKLQENGSEVLIKWWYPEDDEDIEDSGYMYSDLVDVPFELISYKSFND